LLWDEKRGSYVHLAIPNLHNLAVCLANLFDKDGRREAMGEAITLGRAAIELSSLGHPERHCLLDKLASYLHARYLRSETC